MTENSKMILDMINSTKEHLTAEHIYLKLKEKNTAISLASVYNNLKSLNENSLIKKVSISGCPDRYDRYTKHDHLVCDKCGELKDINITDLTSQIEQEVGEKVLSYDLKINYTCKKCRGI